MLQWSVGASIKVMVPTKPAKEGAIADPCYISFVFNLDKVQVMKTC